jgi:hypothetical protein
MNIFALIRETKAHPSDRPDYGKRSKTLATKSRVKVYDTIAQALQRGYMGQIFSTKAAGRLYVISKAGWGEKSSGRIAKGFTPGASTPSSDWKSVKGHSVRTMKKHGKQKSKKFEKYEVKK